MTQASDIDKLIERLRCSYSESWPWVEEAAEALARLQAENERLRAALEEIERWDSAYPLDVFPMLKAGGAMRRAISSIAKIARAALKRDDHVHD